MSTLGKIFLYLSLLGAAVAGGFGYLVIKDYHTARTDRDKNLADYKHQIVLTQEETAKYDAEVSQEAEVEAKLKSATDNVTTLTAQLNDAKAEAAKVTDLLNQNKLDLAKAQGDLAHVNELIGQMSIDDYVAAKKKADADLQDSLAEQVVLNTTLKAAKDDIARLHNLFHNSTIPVEAPGVSGQVMLVNRPWNFVVLNVGLANGVVPNGELIVYRNNTFLGHVKVTRAEENTAVADILPDVKGEIQKGDFVLN